MTKGTTSEPAQSITGRMMLSRQIDQPKPTVRHLRRTGRGGVQPVSRVKASRRRKIQRRPHGSGGYGSCFIEGGMGAAPTRLTSRTPSRSGGLAGPAIPRDFSTTMNKMHAPRQRMDLIQLARESGMAVLLDAQIGREQYVSVSGSLAALARFADAVRSESDESGPDGGSER